MNTIRQNLYNGCTARIIGHTELWIRNPGQPRDTSRWPGYNQQNTADIASHCDRLKKIQFDILMFNTYSIGSWMNKALELYLPATKTAGLNIIVNIDKGIYHGKPSPITEIRAYMSYLHRVVFVQPNYERYNGKFIVTYFAMPGDDPAMFAQIEKENPDCIFVYNGPNFGKSQMSWIHSNLEVGLDQWCSKYAMLKDGGLYIPHFSPGFNDTFQGHSVWDNKPPRVYPPEIGPNSDTLKKHFDVLNKHYSITNQPPYIQGVTVNDWDELTAMEPKADGTGGFFAQAAPPVVEDHSEVWVDGKKVGDLVPNSKELTVVKVMSDKSITKTTYPLGK